MSLRQCDKCTEMVDEAKAFCPGCGHAFVEEEKRLHTSEFDQMDGTVDFGPSMYNLLLSDMGLNISAAPDKPEEITEPVEQQITEAAVQQVVVPASESKAPMARGKAKWIIFGGVVVLVLLILLIAAIVIGFLVWSRLP